MMTSAAGTAQAPTATRARRTAADRMSALGRAELTLLLRSKASLVTAVILPSTMAFAMRGMVEELDLGGTGLSVATVMLPAALATALLFSVYTNLVGVYVLRRESLVLKRLRSGELHDSEILVGSALPAFLLAGVQSLLLAGGMTAFLDADAPAAPHLAVLGLLIGVAMLVAGAALTAAFTRTAESAQLTFLPFLLVTLAASGVFAPREVMPDTMADIASWLPFSPVMDLLRGGWTGELAGTDQIRATLLALAWTGLAVFAVRRWFRWGQRG
ncbi:ABC transporter permease [Streptomyces malaysiensis subsp. malaysiensis]|uniref:ABC transporter permease n=3 Tax=Streptomyces TaxID=1883 RepID=A0ABX6W5B0_STRMQ|nr:MULTISPECIES: ABC transporter permease [Streptomyces]MYU14912.1 ABC transporter permease [Streptomyces sp. SID8361]AUA15485.1 ABC-2 type transporter [Streptomyces sp. M56]MCC4321049.1 ABC transporter permease [Streptomyces malaysiensis]MCD9592678.1 ABC transporter permease [Streptomyces sp. 8ZJF_21]MCM3804825.1 ABC transporter permease [Streptomyces sp. DR7-3]